MAEAEGVGERAKGAFGIIEEHKYIFGGLLIAIVVGYYFYKKTVAAQAASSTTSGGIVPIANPSSSSPSVDTSGSGGTTSTTQGSSLVNPSDPTIQALTSGLETEQSSLSTLQNELLGLTTAVSGLKAAQPSSPSPSPSPPSGQAFPPGYTGCGPSGLSPCGQISAVGPTQSQQQITVQTPASPASSILTNPTYGACGAGMTLASVTGGYQCVPQTGGNPIELQPSGFPTAPYGTTLGGSSGGAFPPGYTGCGQNGTSPCGSLPSEAPLNVANPSIPLPVGFRGCTDLSGNIIPCPGSGGGQGSLPVPNPGEPQTSNGFEFTGQIAPPIQQGSPEVVGSAGLTTGQYITLPGGGQEYVPYGGNPG